MHHNLHSYLGPEQPVLEGLESVREHLRDEPVQLLRVRVCTCKMIRVCRGCVLPTSPVRHQFASPHEPTNQPTNKQTNPQMELPPESFSVVIGADGKVAKCVGNVVMDRSVGNSAGLGGTWRFSFRFRPVGRLVGRSTRAFGRPFPASSPPTPHTTATGPLTNTHTSQHATRRPLRCGGRAGPAGLGLQAHPAPEGVPGTQVLRK